MARYRAMDVLIGGGGSAGLTLALDLAGRGIATTLPAARLAEAMLSVKFNYAAVHLVIGMH